MSFFIRYLDAGSAERKQCQQMCTCFYLLFRSATAQPHIKLSGEFETMDSFSELLRDRKEPLCGVANPSAEARS